MNSLRSPTFLLLLQNLRRGMSANGIWNDSTICTENLYQLAWCIIALISNSDAVLKLFDGQEIVLPMRWWSAFQHLMDRWQWRQWGSDQWRWLVWWGSVPSSSSSCPETPEDASSMLRKSVRLHRIKLKNRQSLAGLRNTFMNLRTPGSVEIDYLHDNLPCECAANRCALPRS